MRERRRGTIRSGTYVLDLAVHPREATGSTVAPSPSGATAAQDFTARTRFVVAEENIENRPPTANLALLRAAAQRTSADGGGYFSIAELPRVLGELARRDQRERSETLARYDIAERDPWGLLAWLAVFLGAEWILRKRGGRA